MESINSFLSSPIPPIVKLIFVGIIVGLFWRRSKSINSLLDRVWRLVVGQGDITDERLSKFIHDNHALEKFRFIYGINVETKQDLHRFLNWVDKNSIGVEIIQQAKRWIDTKSPNLVITPPVKYKKIRGAWILITSILLILCLQMMTSKNTLFRMNESGTWFFANTHYVSGVKILGDTWKIESGSDCQKEIKNIPHIGFNESEMDALCGAFGDQEFNEKIEEGVKAQNNLGIFLSVLALISILWSISQVKSVDAANEIVKRINGAKQTKVKEKLSE